MRPRMTLDERAISRAHGAVAASTTRTRPSSRTDVTRSTAGPTATRHAKLAFPGESGAALSRLARAPGTALLSGRISLIRSYHSSVLLVLASASPRRAELLRAAGFEFETVTVDIDETARAGELPAAYVRRLAAEKSARGLASLAARRDTKDMVVLGADTIVVADATMLGKPRDDTEAAAMLRQLSGRRHNVLTGVSLRQGEIEVGRVEWSAVYFSELTDDEIAWYLASGEGRDKAGAYAIQGRASRFIPRIEGSYSNIVGLPVACVYELVSVLASR
jgi:septum formation protein